MAVPVSIEGVTRPSYNAGNALDESREMSIFVRTVVRAQRTFNED
jgi:hypothetical protein